MNDNDLQNQLAGLFSGLENNDPPVDLAPLLDSTPAAKSSRLQPLDPPRWQPAAAAPASPAYPRPGVNWRLIIWSVLITLAAIMLAAYSQVIFGGPQANPAAGLEPRFVLPLTPTATLTPTANPTAAALSFTEPTPMPTAIPGGRVLVLTPAPADAGWAAAGEEEILYSLASNHFGDAFLYAGVAGGRAYVAAFQINLNQIPRGTKIYAAALRLTGLRDDQLNPGGAAAWHVDMLNTDVDYQWRSRNYRQLAGAGIWARIGALPQAQLAAGQENIFEFSPAQLNLLERRLLEGSDRFGKQVSFRLTGPTHGPDNLFAWDGGSGASGKKAGPQLWLSVGPPPKETPPPYFVLITSTPTPKTIATAVANSLRMTAAAARDGTATPVPPYWVTPIVVTATPTAQNQATAAAMADMATAIAFTTGEPRTMATATATATYVVITSTPTPEDIATAAAQARRATAQAIQGGTATPFPANWVTPVVVTSTPAPENTATVEYWQAVALTTGTPTPLPGNAQTATPTPVAVTALPLASATATATPSPTPQPIPDALLGKILFLSDREGATEEERLRADKRQATPQVTPQPYAFDLATGQLERLTDRWPYDVAAARDHWSADARFEAYTQALLWTNINGYPTNQLAIHAYDYLYHTEQIVTRMGAGLVYDPAWSPVSEEIVFVATESGNDEIWLTNRAGADLRQLTRNQWEWDKHPSWSPDGQHIVFFSNRTGVNQLWLMDKDGNNQRLLMATNAYNDFDPVWVKTLDPAPPAARLPDWRFVKPEGE